MLWNIRGYYHDDYYNPESFFFQIVAATNLMLELRWGWRKDTKKKELYLKLVE